MVRNKTGKSLIVGAYMEEPGIDYTVPGGKATNGAGKDALAGKPLQADATLLVDAKVAAAGGYHMSIAALPMLMQPLTFFKVPITQLNTSVWLRTLFVSFQLPTVHHCLCLLHA